MAAPPKDSTDRQTRLAAALRENLRKRKAQARAREDAAQAETGKAKAGEQPKETGGA